MSRPVEWADTAEE